MRYIEGFSSPNLAFFYCAVLLLAVFPSFFFSFSLDFGVSLTASEVEKKNAVYGKWNRNVILATHGRISVAATVCACFVFTYVLNLLLRITLSLDTEGVATRSVNEKVEVQYGPL